MAVNINELYKCKHCGIIAEIVHGGQGEMVCCGEPMTLLHANSVDAKIEKHVPVIKQYGDICHVLVGSELHPMTTEHNIVWIEIAFSDRIIRHYLKPGEKPEAQFCGIDENAEITASAYCNLHGLWKSCKGCIN